MSDIADLAETLEQQQRDRALAAVRNQNKEAPWIEGADWLCLDCTEVIPPARVAAIGAVRCVECQELLEN